MGKMARKLKALNYKGPALAILVDDTRVKEAEGGLENAIFASYPESSKSFQEAFQRKFKIKPGITSDTAYDSLHLYANVINQIKDLRPAYVAKNLLQVDYHGASGHIVFDAFGGVIKQPTFYVVKGSEFITVSAALFR